MLTRRRLLTISAALALTPAALRAGTPPPVAHLWSGQALGARASIRLAHPDAQAISTRVLAEIDRLEDILSLYRPDSALMRLNRDGQLDAPPFELLECLSLAGAVHGASGGRFDPTVQPLWALWAEAAAAGHRPAPAAIDARRAAVGWNGVALDSNRITLRPDAGLTLNGIGQGYVADRVAALLTAEGLSEILIDTGEFRALGGRPGGGAWQVTLAAGGQVGLSDRALATSSPLGTTFDQAGRDGHIIDPATGRPIKADWREVTISAPSAALADALSTAACMMSDPEAVAAMVAQFPGARVEAVV